MVCLHWAALLCWSGLVWARPLVEEAAAAAVVWFGSVWFSGGLQQAQLGWPAGAEGGVPSDATAPARAEGRPASTQSQWM